MEEHREYHHQLEEQKATHAERKAGAVHRRHLHHSATEQVLHSRKKLETRVKPLHHRRHPDRHMVPLTRKDLRVDHSQPDQALAAVRAELVPVVSEVKDPQIVVDFGHSAITMPEPVPTPEVPTKQPTEQQGRFRRMFKGIKGRW